MTEVPAMNRAVAIGEAMIEMAPAGDGRYLRGFAGDTFNTAWHMAQALEDRTKVGFVTRVGTDPLSDAFIAELAGDGLDASGIGRDPRRSMGLYLIQLDGVERSFLYWREDSATRGLADDEAWLGRVLEGAGLIHFSGITLAILTRDARAALLRRLRDARAGGARISFDPNIRPKLWSSLDEVRETIPRFLQVTDIALPSFDDEAATWGDPSPCATLDRFVSAGVAEVVVKNGAGAVTWHSNGASGLCETQKVDGIRDTTGAGDAFNAGYLAARLLGRDTAEAVRYGQRMSGEVIRHLGARIPPALVPRID